MCSRTTGEDKGTQCGGEWTMTEFSFLGELILGSPVSRLPSAVEFNDDHYCGTLLHSVIDSQGFLTTRKASWVVSFVYLFRQIWQL